MKKLAAALSKAAELDARLAGKSVPADYRDKMRVLEAGIFRLVVMGEIKKGKSSFINAMLGYQNLVPTSSNVATSTIFKIRYGKEVAYKVYFTEQSQKPTLTIGPEELPKYGTEDGNPGNQKQVEFIEVSCPSPVLQTGIVVIDTPGLGGVFSEHKKITYQYIPKADAVFFVTDSVDSPIGALETEYLEDVYAITKHVYFVQTKFCSVDEDAANARKRNNMEILSNALQCDATKIPYFMLDSAIRFSAKEGQNKDLLMLSGFPDLLSFVNRKLLPAQKLILAKKAIVNAAPVLQHLDEQVAAKERLLSADTEAKRKKMEEELLSAQRSLQDWQTRGKEKFLRELSNGMAAIRCTAIEQLAKCRPNGEVQEQIDQMIFSAQSKEQVQQILEQQYEGLPEFASKCTHEACRYMQRETEKLFAEVFEDCSNTGNVPSSELALCTNVNCAKIGRLIQDIANSGSVFNEMRTGLYGGLAGAAIASTVGAIVGSVIPVVGTIIGSGAGLLIASFWGGKKACDIQAANELKSFQHQASNAISSALSDIHNKMTFNFERMHNSLKNSVQEAVADALANKAEELKRKQADIQNRVKMDSAELARQSREHDELKSQVQAINHVVAEYLPKTEK